MNKTTINPIEIVSGNTTQKLEVNDKSVFKVSLKGKIICLVFNTGIGDVLFALPLIKYLQSLGKTLKIEIGVPQLLMFLFGTIPGVKVFPLQELPIRQNYANHLYNFGQAITKFMPSELMLAAKAYFKYLDKDFDFTGYEDEYFRPELPVNEQALNIAQQFFKKHSLYKYPVVALQLRASAPIRSWLPEYNRKVAFKLAKKGYKVLLFDRTADWEVKNDNIILVKEELVVIYAMLSLCDLIIGPDSSFMQMGLALRKPVIGIYGPFPAEYRLGNLKDTFPVECDRNKKTGFICSPCNQHKAWCPNGVIPSPCMESIKPERVLRLANIILKDRCSKKELCKPSKAKKNGNCTYCGSEKHNLLVEWGEMYETGKVCSDCRSVYDPSKQTELMTSIYNDPQYFASRYLTPGYIKDCDYIYKSLKEILPDVKLSSKDKVFKIADIGCGIGTVAAMMRTIPHSQVFGVDISTHASFLGKKINSFDITVRNFLKEEIWKPKELDMITMIHYIEHSGGLDVHANIEKANHYLKPGGYLYIYSPSTDAFMKRSNSGQLLNKKWIHLSGGDHIDIPSKKGLTALLEKHNFKVLTIRDRGGDDLDCIALKQ